MFLLNDQLSLFLYLEPCDLELVHQDEGVHGGEPSVLNDESQASANVLLEGRVHRAPQRETNGVVVGDL